MIGGGSQVATSVCLVMIADIFSEEERYGDFTLVIMSFVLLACRSNALFRLQSCVLVAEILATPLGAYLMTFEPAYPFVLGLIIAISGFLPIILLPETLEDAKAKKLSQQKANANVTDSETDIEPTEPLDKAMLPELLRQIREFKDSTRFIWRDWNICLMIFTMIVGVMTRQSTTMLLQYSSKKFNWSLARVWMPA